MNPKNSEQVASYNQEINVLERLVEENASKPVPVNDRVPPSRRLASARK